MTIRGIDLNRIATPTAMERWPWPLRALLGVCASVIAVAITYLILPLRSFPLLLAFPTVVLASWFLGMWGGIACGISDAVLVDQFLTRTEFSFSIGFAREEIRLAVFLLVSLLLGYAIRRLAQQRALLATQELQQRLIGADAERQFAEERARASEVLRDRDDLLQIALRANGMGLWAWDLQRDTVHCSDEMYSMYGKISGSTDCSSKEWMKLIHPEDLPNVTHILTESRDTESEVAVRYRIPRPDGLVRWIETRCKYQKDSHGKLARLVGVSTDITNRKHSEEAMLRAEKLAVAGRLAATVAHEINNPLEAIANLLYLISHAESLDTARAEAQQALDELMRVSMITQQTLKFHRQSGTPRLTQLSEIVQTVLALFRGRMKAAQIVADMRADREVSIACMPNEVQQIFANLISNAIDAMPRSGRLFIRLRPSCDWRNRQVQGMRVTFCDSGIGMSRETIQRIFEPFYTTKLDTGTGLGMWVVAQLVERHHGEVRVWSTQRASSSATIISVFLPASAVQ